MLTREQVYQKVQSEQKWAQWPDNIKEILYALGQPEAVDINELAEMIEQDKELADTLLRNLNSGGYRLSRHVESVKQAILFLGIQSVRNVLLFFISHRFFPANRKKESLLFATQVYWDHMLATALAADSIARLKQMDEKQAYLMFSYGLIHDIGHLVIDGSFPDEVLEINRLLAGGVPMLEAEARVLGGVTHPEMGAWICEQAGFSKQLVDTIRHHHDSYEIGHQSKMMTILGLADIIGTQYVQKELPPQMHRTIDERWLEELGISKADMQEIRSTLPQRMENFKERPVGLQAND